MASREDSLLQGVEGYIRDLVAGWVAYLVWAGTTKHLSQWVWGQLLCQEFEMDEAAQSKRRLEPCGLGPAGVYAVPRGNSLERCWALPMFGSRRRSSARTTRPIGTSLFSTRPQEPPALPGEEASVARQRSNFSIVESQRRQNAWHYGPALSSMPSPATGEKLGEDVAASIPMGQEFIKVMKGMPRRLRRRLGGSLRPRARPRPVGRLRRRWCRSFAFGERALLALSGFVEEVVGDRQPHSGPLLERRWH